MKTYYIKYTINCDKANCTNLSQIDYIKFYDFDYFNL